MLLSGNDIIKVSLGLKQPVGPAPSVLAGWEVNLRASSVTLRTLRKALEAVGLTLSLGRVRTNFAVESAVWLSVNNRILIDHESDLGLTLRHWSALGETC